MHVSRKPTRKDLLRVVSELQDLIGEAMAAHDNDRDPDSQLKVRTPLAKGFDLCVQARKFDPPSERQATHQKRGALVVQQD